MTYEYSAPERLEQDWRQGRRTPPGEMLEELSDDIDGLSERVSEGDPFVAVQGRISDYKSWLAAAVAKRLSDDGTEVVLFSPQTANRDSAVTKLRAFGAELLEHPGRIDLCIWEPWRDNIGYVDKTTCESIGCPFYEPSEERLAETTQRAVSSHAMFEGGEIKMDAETMKDLGRPGEHNICPAQLYLEARGLDITDGAVGVATYAKAFADAAVADDDPLDADVVVLDEAHTVAANPEVTTSDVESGALLEAVGELAEHLDGMGERWAIGAHRDVVRVRTALEEWIDRSEEDHVNPDAFVEDCPVMVADAFETLDTVDERLLEATRRHNRDGDWESVREVYSILHGSGRLRAFLSMVQRYRNGGMDFVHSIYEENGERVNEMAFRSVDPDADIGHGTTPGAVFRRWQDEGTHPIIGERWGTLLDRYIESLWEGRALYTADGTPGAPVMPMDRLRDISGADTTITMSATHNDLSDPTGGPSTGRPTRHTLLCAPVHLRATGTGRGDYDGNDSVSPDTPWFRSLVERAKEESGDNLVAVPINYTNASKWGTLPVKSIETDDGEFDGIVPNSRGSIGEKGLESMNVDTVMCGVQVQAPAATALRLMRWWEMLAPRYSDPGDVLETSWRLLAQHAVSGTVQAGGRFDWDATNLVFERPGLFELAGFEVREATPDSPGFAGEFCRLYEQAAGEWADRRGAVRAAKVVRYLRQADRKTASLRQTIGEFRRVYDADEEQARRAIWLALDRGKIESEETDKGARLKLP